MQRGTGFFFCRKKRKYIEIYEHATDAVTRPDIFNSHEVTHLNPVVDREEIVLSVLKKGFIRIRDWQGKLGWQFWGNPDSSLYELKNYIRKKELTDWYEITFTDFENKIEFIQPPSYFKKLKGHICL